MSNASVLSIPPSEYWEGADGSWSTLSIQVGTPGQAVRLLPGTSATAADSTWVVIEEGCSVLNANLTDCSQKRGGIFARNRSSTWTTAQLPNNGLLSLDSFEERGLGLDGNNGYFGFDTIQLGPSGSLSTSHQLVAGIATNDYFFGSLGLSPQAFNISDDNSPIPSLLGNLRSNQTINSTSWSYTAGKYYASPPLFGSLTLGGYDAARLNGSSVQVPFYQDISRDLLLGVKSIKVGDTSLLSSGVYAFLDSLVPDIWLPVDACQLFEKALGITWNSQAGRYLVSDDQHSALLAKNPTFTFEVAASTSDGSSTTITFPYAAFDLNLTAPYSNPSSRYFPLKRAANSTQYTLGRTFFQEAYIIADYDRKVFNVSQAATLGSGAAAQLVALNQTIITTPSSSSLPAGAIAGIVVGIVVLAAITIGAVWLMRRKRRQRRLAGLQEERADVVYPDDKKEDLDESSAMLPLGELDSRAVLGQELDARGTALHEMPSAVKSSELSSGADAQVHELGAPKAKTAELSGSDALIAEMAANGQNRRAANRDEMYELPA